nr:hypothetical protein [uncultured Carboxylicivirga sp.]
MRTIPIILFLTFALSCFSQTVEFEIKTSKKAVGKKLADNSELLADCHTFPKRIEKISVSIRPNEITVFSRGVSPNGKWLDNNGNYIRYDYKRNKVNWSKKHSYPDNLVWYYETDSVIIYNGGFRSWVLDYTTGKILKYYKKNNIYHYQPNLNVGIAYGFDGAYGPPVIRGFELTKGKELWHEELADKRGWDNLFVLSDSTALVVSKGISMLNLKTGKVWQNTEVIRAREPESYTASSFKLYKNFVTASFSEYQGEYNSKTNNNLVFVDSSEVFVLNQNSVASISLKNGITNWNQSLTFNSSNNNIRIDSNNFYIFNRDLSNQEKTVCNFAFISKSEGKKIFEKHFEEQIIDYKVSDGKVFFITENKVLKFDLLTETKELEKDFSNETFGTFKFFLQGQKIYQDNEGLLSPLEKSNESKLILLTNQNNIITLTENLEISSNFNGDDFYLSRLETENFNIISKGKNLSVLNSAGKIMAEIEITKNATVKDDIIYDWNDKELNIIDLTNLN